LTTPFIFSTGKTQEVEDMTAIDDASHDNEEKEGATKK